MSEILATNHVGFTVEDMDRGIALFTDVFGYEVISLATRDPVNVRLLTGVEDADILVCHLRRPGLVGVELIQYRQPEDSGRVIARPCATGYTHLTFDVSDLDATVARAAAYGMHPIGGVSTSTGGPNEGARAVYLRDQEGISIELIQPARFAKGLDDV
jgi:glyoxylase I family protein